MQITPSCTSRLPRRNLAVAVAAALAATIFVCASTSSAPAAISGDKPWAIILCRFTDQTEEPHSLAYYQRQMTAAGAGTNGLYDYWHDISYGRLSIAGSRVFGWFTVPMPRYRFNGLARTDRIAACLHEATGVRFSDFYGVIAVSNQLGTPTPIATTLASVINARQTTITVSSSAGFPVPPFPVVVGDDPDHLEKMNVTAVRGTSWTVTRAYADSIPGRPETTGVTVALANTPDLGAASIGQTNWTIDGRPVPLAAVDSFAGADLSGLAHETGHGFGLVHSRLLSTSTQDYNDCWDIMSVYSCVRTFPTAYGSGGPGLDAIGLDVEGWLDPSRRALAKPSGCSPTTVSLTALSEGATRGGYLEVRVPSAVQVATPNGGKTTSDYYTVELRTPTHWDTGIQNDAVLVHLHGRDGYGYLVDLPAHVPPDHVPGTGYASPTGVVIGVDSIDPIAHTARVSIARCPIPTRLTYTGPTAFEKHDSSTLSALVTTGDGTPVAGLRVDLYLGTNGCGGYSDASGRVSCTASPDTGLPGSRVVSATFAGTSIFGGSAAGRTAALTPDESAIDYTGDLVADFGGTAHVSAHVYDPPEGFDDLPVTAGGTVRFQIGSDSCSGLTDALGSAACSLPLPREPGGLTTVTASYVGYPASAFASSSSSREFLIRKVPVSLVNNAPSAFLQLHSATLSAILTTVGGTPLAGRSLTLGLGSESCTASTGADGTAACDVTPTDDTGPVVADATFAGDADYLPVTDRRSALIYAFPKNGAFVISRTAAATRTTIQWWGKDWTGANPLPDIGIDPFAGFASSLGAAPPFCKTVWEGLPGTDGAPPESVPQYMGVLVTPDVAALDGTYTGETVRIAVVKTDGGYTPALETLGTGTVEGYAC